MKLKNYITFRNLLTVMFVRRNWHTHSNTYYYSVLQIVAFTVDDFIHLIPNHNKVIKNGIFAKRAPINPVNGNVFVTNFE